MKDIFIDNNIAKNFANPADEEYKRLIEWLQAFEEGSQDNAFLVVSRKLLMEYIRSSQNAALDNTNIQVIIALLTRQGRLNSIINEDIKNFKAKHFTKAVEKRLRSNSEDRDHIPAVLLSERKMALTRDDNFLHDLLNFPGFSGVRVAKRPQDIPYSQ